MAKDKSFHDYVVHDLLGEVRGVTSRGMFGGWCLYKNGFVFGLILDGELYFKVDDKNRGDYEQIESKPFIYAKKKGKPITMCYWLVPEAVMEDNEQLVEFLEKSVAVSRREKS